MEKYRQGGYLFHGSPYRIERLQTRPAHDKAYEVGCQNAVYATDSLDMAICFALGVEGDGDGERIMMPVFGKKMLFKNCHPRYGQKGYIYVLERDEFTHAMGSQWVAYTEQTPVDIIEIEVDDYVKDYCILAYTEEQHMFVDADRTKVYEIIGHISRFISPFSEPYGYYMYYQSESDMSEESEKIYLEKLSYAAKNVDILIDRILRQFQHQIEISEEWWKSLRFESFVVNWVEQEISGCLSEPDIIFGHYIECRWDFDWNPITAFYC